MRLFRLMICAVATAGAPVALHAQIGTPPTPAAPVSAPATAGVSGAVPSVPQDYRLGVADHVRVSVYNELDLSGEFTVNANGVLALPLIGDVPVLDNTASQVVDKIQRKLADGYLTDPHVSLEVLTYRPYYIMGEVNKPGEYPYSNSLTVLNAVAAAGGFTYRANKHDVFLRHPGEDQDRKIAIAPGLQIQPGDTIRIGERYF